MEVLRGLGGAAPASKQPCLLHGRALRTCQLEQLQQGITASSTCLCSLPVAATPSPPLPSHISPSCPCAPYLDRCLPDPDVASKVVQMMPPLHQWRRFVYCTGMVGGRVLGMVDHFK